MDPSERFETLVAEFADLPGVIPPGATKGFGSGALRIQGKITDGTCCSHAVDVLAKKTSGDLGACK